MKKTILTLLAFMAMSIPAVADPANRLGQSVKTLYAQIEGLNETGATLFDGYSYTVNHDQKAKTVYYVKGDRVVKEEFTFYGSDSDTEYIYYRFIDDFNSQKYKSITEGNDKITFLFLTVKIEISLYRNPYGNNYCRVTYTRP